MSEGYLLQEGDLLPLSIGAALLGTGGGGNPYVGMLRARELIRKGAQVRVLPLDALPDDAWVGEVGGIGAPVVGVEKIEEGGECYRAMRAVEEAANVRVSALISAEIGGANSIEPIIAAALAGLPVIDGFKDICFMMEYSGFWKVADSVTKACWGWRLPYHEADGVSRRLWMWGDEVDDTPAVATPHFGW